jgi:Uma2 family endonuclease
MNIVLREPWSVERFLAWEDTQEGKHEFDGSRIIEMTGGSRTHQRIIFNLMRLLVDRLDPGAYDAVQEMRLEVAGKIRYPE